MASILPFPPRGDALVASKLRQLLQENGLSLRQQQRAMSRYLSTLQRERRSNGVASYEALKLVRDPSPVDALGGAA